MVIHDYIDDEMSGLQPSRMYMESGHRRRSIGSVNILLQQGDDSIDNFNQAKRVRHLIDSFSSYLTACTNIILIFARNPDVGDKEEFEKIRLVSNKIYHILGSIYNQISGMRRQRKKLPQGYWDRLPR
jgi:hypothetical protein